MQKISCTEWSRFRGGSKGEARLHSHGVLDPGEWRRNSFDLKAAGVNRASMRKAAREPGGEGRTTSKRKRQLTAEAQTVANHQYKRQAEQKLGGKK